MKIILYQEKGFGFISIEGWEDIFVHRTAIESEGFRMLQEGDKVDFEIVQGDKGNKAENVKKI